MHRARQLLAVAALAPAAALAQTACATLDATAAAALVGGPVVAGFRSDTPASASNGHDHATVCGFFPKGYDIRTADRPPERGVQVTLHTMRSPADARNFHTNTSEMVVEMAQARKTGAKFAAVPGVGEAAQLETGVSIDGVDVAHLRFLKGKVAAQVTAWRKGAPAGDTATAAAKAIAGKL